MSSTGTTLLVLIKRAYEKKKTAEGCDRLHLLVSCYVDFVIATFEKLIVSKAGISHEHSEV